MMSGGPLFHRWLATARQAGRRLTLPALAMLLIVMVLAGNTARAEGTATGDPVSTPPTLDAALKIVGDRLDCTFSPESDSKSRFTYLCGSAKGGLEFHLSRDGAWSFTSYERFPPPSLAEMLHLTFSGEPLPAPKVDRPAKEEVSSTAHDGNVYTQPLLKIPTPSEIQLTHRYGGRLLRLISTWILAILLLVWTLFRAVPLLRAFKDVIGRNEGLGLGALLLTIAILIWTVPPWQSAHNHNSFDSRAGCAFAAECDVDIPGWSPSIYHLYGALYRLNDFVVQSPQRLNFVLSLLSLLLTYIAVRVFFHHVDRDKMGRHVALWAVAFTGFQPLFLRLSVTSTFWPLTTCLLAWSFISLMVASRSKRLDDALAAGAAVGLLATTSITLFALAPLLVLGIACWSKEGLRATLQPRYWAAGAIVALHCLPQVLFFTAGLNEEEWARATTPFLIRAAETWAWQIFSDVRLYPPAVSLFLLIGLVVCLKHWKRSLPFLLCFAITEYYLSSMQNFETGYPGRLLFGHTSLHLGGVAAAVGFASIGSHLRRWLGNMGLAFVGMAAIASGFLASEAMFFLHTPRPLGTELQMIAAQLGQLPEHETILTPPRIMNPLPGLSWDDDPVEAVYPAVAHQEAMHRRFGVRPNVIDYVSWSKQPKQNPESVLLYMGSTFFTFQPSEIASDKLPVSLERQPLTDLRAAYDLIPVRTFPLSTANHPTVVMKVGAGRKDEIELGYYWIRAKQQDKSKDSSPRTGKTREKELTTEVDRPLEVSPSSNISSAVDDYRRSAEQENTYWRPSIAPGHELRIQNLVLPYKLDNEVYDGWRLAEIRIRPHHIEFELQRSDDEPFLFVMARHPRDVSDDDAPTTRNFRLEIIGLEEDGPSPPATAALVKALQQNDTESFWKMVAPANLVARRDDSKTSIFAEREVSAYSSVALAVLALLLFLWTLITKSIHSTILPLTAGLLLIGVILASNIQANAPMESLGIDAALVVLTLLFTFWSLITESTHSHILRTTAGAVLFIAFMKCPWLLGDTLTFLCCIPLFVVVAFRRSSAGDPRWIGWTLIGITLVGAVFRWQMAPETFLGAWPWWRTHAIARPLLRGDALAALTQSGALTFGEFEMVRWINLSLACLTPLCVFSHARYLLGRPEPALLASAFLAFLPGHIRFSQSEVQFIPSLVLSTIVFALAHMALKDPSRRYRYFALAILPILSVKLVLMRPLNVLFVLLFIATPLLLRRGSVPKARIAAMVIATAGFAGVVGGYYLLGEYPDNIHEGLSLETVMNGLMMLFDFEYNTLINPWITPPLLTFLALVGIYQLVKQQRSVGIYLTIWLGMFFFAHAYVIGRTPEMNARYHLHLVIPFVMLASGGWFWLELRRTLIAKVVLITVLLAPLLHVGFIQSTDFNQMNEVSFLERHHHLIPNGCDVLEGAPKADLSGHSRIARMKTYAARGEFGPTVRSHAFHATKEGVKISQRSTLQALTQSPSNCTYFYEGLPCYWQVEGKFDLDCETIRRSLRLETLVEETFDNQSYDVFAGSDAKVTFRISRVLGFANPD